MGILEQECDAADVGLDAARLERLDRHFRAYVDDGRLPGWLITVARHGKLAHVSAYGQRDTASGAPVTNDTIWRIYSMTKPITAVAGMILAEEGAYELNDPVARYLPALREQRVWRSGTLTNPAFDPVVERMRIWHLLAHMSGFTYGFANNHPVDAMYRAAGFEWGVPPRTDLAGICDILAGLPLLFQPGAEWCYSMGLDVLGRVIEIATGQTLDAFLDERIFGPLGMTETGWYVAAERADRLAALYGAGPRKTFVPLPTGSAALKPPAALLGGGGLVSTAHDYHRFTTMLLNRGELDGMRILSPRTIDYMTRNHLPGGVDLSAIGRPLFSETTFDGVGFGLGMSVTIDPVKAKVPGSVGEFGWGGAASTAFWVDPVEDLTVQFFTQLLPSSTYPIRSQLKSLVYQSIVD